MKKWRVIPIKTHDPAVNMAIDEALMYSVADGDPIIRFFKWNPPSVSLAYKQNLGELDLDACRELGVKYTRRPTGGRAIYHDPNEEFSYSVIAPRDILPPGLQSYQEICGWIINGLKSLGLSPELVNKNDVLVEARKIVGSAQYHKFFPERGSRVLLQQGSINYRTEYLKKTFEVFRVREMERAMQAASEYITSISDYSGVSLQEAYERIRDAFLDGKNFDESELTPEELERAEALAREKYGEQTEWTVNEGRENRGFCHLIWGSQPGDIGYMNEWDGLL
ncbi:MAG: biotin/lipoate A/B protein ligase family protein [Candidatus Aenigmatarchaeota archaeon]